MWNIDEAKWEESFKQLIIFKELNGHFNVSRSITKYKSLGRWVLNQKEKYRKGKLFDDHIKKLESIGFVLDTKISLV